MSEISGEESPCATIRRILSNKRSCNADQAHKEADSLKNFWRTNSSSNFPKIGAGACGEIYQLLGSSCDSVAKRAKTDEYAEQLRSDHAWHLRIVEALSRRREALGLDILVPEPGDLADSTKPNKADWWTTNRSRFPPRVATLPELVLISERVMPLPRSVRRGLIDIYCRGPGTQRASAHTDPGNLDCLIRPYLGKPRPERRTHSSISIFGLRNFQLYRDDMETLHLDLERYAGCMARSLALLHWELRCDGKDVEFVLGGARDPDKAVEMWMLDFNRVRGISMDGEGVGRAVEAFMVNDRYFPRPLSGDVKREGLWRVFQEGYLEGSARLRVLQSEESGSVDWKGLPEEFLAGVVEAQRTLLRDKEEAIQRGR